LYNVLANEYYDRILHPTSANMREASLIAMRSFLGNATLGRVCELGAGRSVFVDLPDLYKSTRKIVLLDESPAMLAHSNNLETVKVVSSVEASTLLPNSFDTVIASLGDAYNTLAAWRRVVGTLANGGRLFYTGPAPAWAEGFRGVHQIGHADEAVFETAGGTVVVPSHILSEGAQFKVWQEVGLEPLQWMNIYPTALSAPLSPKILRLDEPFCVAALAQLR
jgi:SAM-dependent methyltransferase